MITLLHCLILQILAQAHDDITLTTHNPSLLYFAALDLGSSENLLVKIDTMQTQLMVPGSVCSVGEEPCGKPTDLYNATSPLAAFLPCTAFFCKCREVPEVGNDEYCVVPISSSGCSLEATANQDELHFNNVHTNITFGMIFSASPRYLPPTPTGQIYGILGIGAESNQDPTSINSFYQHIFALCLGPEEGHFVLGGVEPKYGGSMRWFQSQSSQYSLTVTNISTKHASPTNMQPISAYLDSGEEDVLLSTSIYKIVKALLLERACSENLPFGCSSKPNHTIFGNRCFPMNAEMLPKYPTLMFGMLNEHGISQQVLWEPSFYFKDSVNYWGYNCVTLAIKESPKLPDNVMIFGNSFLRRYYTVFDRKNSLIGLADPKCGNWTVGVDNSSSAILDLVIIGGVFTFMATTITIYFVYLALGEVKSAQYELIQ